MAGREAEASSDTGGAGQVQSVDRALTILEIIADAGADVGVTDIAGRLGIHKSTVSRLIATLESHSLVQAGERGGYRLGLGLLGLAASAAFSLDLVKLAQPALRELSRATGETANLAVLVDDAALYLDQVSGTSTLQAHSWVGQRIPLHATSNGKVLLAFSDPELLDRISSRQLASHTATTLVDPGALRREIEQVHAQGWAVAVDELEPGLAAIAAPIHGFRAELVGSLSISGPSFRMEPILTRLTEQVIAAAGTVSRSISNSSG